MPAQSPPSANSVSFVELLNQQIGNELATELQYLSCAAYYDTQTMPQTARFFYAHALEQHKNALRMVRYLVLTANVQIPRIVAPKPDFVDAVAPVSLAVDRIRAHTEQINQLVRSAQASSDFTAEQFMQWFVGAQTLVTSTMGDLLAVAIRNPDRLDDIEEYVARRHGQFEVDPTAPRAAGDQ